jgi:uncharacterized protein YecE (DUF72 family)
MEFGRLANVDRVDFALPTARNHCPLSSMGTRATKPRTLVGLPVWAKKEFVGPIYPAGTKSADFLKAYGARFPSLELNATHYGMPDQARIHAWCTQVPEPFKFCPKVPQSISHSFAPNRAELDTFAERVSEFGERLGPCLLQFPEYADKAWRRTVFELTRAFPHSLALELRHPDWFADLLGVQRLSAYLAERGIAWVITDSAGRRDAVHMVRTAPFTFVRFLGNSLHATDFARVDAWSERLRAWEAEGATSYFFLHQPREVDCMPLFERMTEPSVRT